MSVDPGQALQKAIFEHLSAAATIKALIGDPPRLFDHVTPGTAFPLASIGHIQVSDWSSKTFNGADCAVTLHVFSRSRGRKEVRAILEAMFVLLQDASLTLEGHSLVALRFQFSEVLLDEDGLTYHGVARYRARTQQNP